MSDTTVVCALRATRVGPAAAQRAADKAVRTPASRLRARPAPAAALVLASIALACTDGLVTPDGAPAPAVVGSNLTADGEIFRVGASPAVHLAYGGSRFGVPDVPTLHVCTGSFPGMVRTVAALPALADGGALPSVDGHEWMAGAVPVKGDASAAVYVVVGCVKSAVPDLPTLRALFGDNVQVATAPQAVVDQVPTGQPVRVPLRRSGTLIQGPGTAEVRWVTQVGVAVAVGIDALNTYCLDGGDRVPEAVDAEEWAAYPPTGALPSSSVNCVTEQPPIVRDGEFFQVAHNPATYLSQQGRAYAIPDPETLEVCTGGYPQIVRQLLAPPALRDGGVLPSAREHPFMRGEIAVRSEGHPAVFAVIGCARSAVPDPEMFFAVFGPAGASRTVVVPDALLASLPRAGSVRLPLRRPGTLIRTETGAEIRWVTYVGGSMAVARMTSLSLLCRTNVVLVSVQEFAAYPARTRLDHELHPHCGPWYAPALQPDFRLPLPGGLAWRLEHAAGEGSNVGELHYALDFLPLTEALPGQPPQEWPNVPVLAAAAGLVSHVGVTPEYGVWVLMAHESGFNTIYAHLEEGSLRVGAGQTVEAGQVLASMGATGNAAHRRLHFEVRRFEQGAGSMHAPWLEQLVLEGHALPGYRSDAYYLSSNAPLPPDALVATVTTSAPIGTVARETDRHGLVWHQGDVVVTARPTLYGGPQQIDDITVCITPQDGPNSGVSACRTTTTLVNGEFVATFPKGTPITAADEPGAGEVSTTDLRVAVHTTVGGQPGPSLVVPPSGPVHGRSTIRLDNVAPMPPSLELQNVFNNWVGAHFGFHYQVVTSPATDLQPGIGELSYTYHVVAASAYAELGSTDAARDAAVVATGMEVWYGYQLPATNSNVDLILVVRARDALGNHVLTRLPTPFGVDLQPPEITAVAGTPADWMVNPATPFMFTFTDDRSGFAADPVRVYMARYDGVSWNCVNVNTGVEGSDQCRDIELSGTTIFEVPATEGLYFIQVFALDRAGNRSASLMRYLVRDNTAPTISVQSFAIAADQVTINAEAVDNIALHREDMRLQFGSVSLPIRRPSQLGGLGWLQERTSLSGTGTLWRGLQRVDGAGAPGTITHTTGFGFGAWDRAYNFSEAFVGVSTASDGAPADLGTFLIATSGTAVCTGVPVPSGDLAGRDCPAGAAAVPEFQIVTATASGPAGTLENPFTSVNFYYTDVNGNAILFQTIRVPALIEQTSPTAQRLYRWTAVFDPANLPAGYETTVFAVGVDAQQDALMSNSAGIMMYGARVVP